jgi:TrmH family RNA methyltransferase
LKPPVLVQSRGNAQWQRLRRLAQQPAAYRREGEVWLEGDHLCRAAVARGWRPSMAVFAETAWADPALRTLATAAASVLLLDDTLFDALSGLASAGRVGFTVAVPAARALEPGVPTVVLDRVQDAGNVGSLLRSAAALGASQVVALKGTAALWSPKVLRAAMGAHFALVLHEAAQPALLDTLGVPLVATTPHGGVVLPEAELPDPCAWVFSHEGQGIGPELLARCGLAVRIPQPGGEESLNVAAAGAICLYESARQRAAARRAPH